jgi:hypothetical protein
MIPVWGSSKSGKAQGLSRRGVLALGTGALLALSARTPALGGEMPPVGRVRFDVLRDGVVVGSHVIEMTDRGGQREVHSAIDIVVDLLGVTVYLFKQHSLEVWSPDRLLSLESETTEDDASFWVKGRALADAFDIESRKEHASAPTNIMVASYWRPQICQQGWLIEPKHGRLRQQSLLDTRRVTVARAGADIPAQEYRVRGILDGACTYDTRGTWLGAWFQKQGKIVYRAVL